jgi:peroxiredoxin
MFIMPPLKTPICDFGTNAKDFKLNSTDIKLISLNDIKGDAGTFIMFICNHCPYVKAVIQDIVEDCKNLEKFGIKAVAISSNDTINYPEDNFKNMIRFSKEHQFNFPYLFDETQNVAKSYNAVCTPDFFGFNHNLELQYRGRIRELDNLKPVRTGDSDLFISMKQIAETGKGPETQIPSIGCSIKWLNN